MTDVSLPKGTAEVVVPTNLNITIGVESVNSKTGAVELNANDVHAASSDTAYMKHPWRATEYLALGPVNTTNGSYWGSGNRMQVISWTPAISGTIHLVVGGNVDNPAPVDDIYVWQGSTPDVDYPTASGDVSTFTANYLVDLYNYGGGAVTGDLAVTAGQAYTITLINWNTDAHDTDRWDVTWLNYGMARLEDPATAGPVPLSTPLVVNGPHTLTMDADGFWTPVPYVPKHVQEGTNNTATGYSAHVEGDSVTASGDYSHAEGYSTTASRLAESVRGLGEAQQSFNFLWGSGGGELIDHSNYPVFTLDHNKATYIVGTAVWVCGAANNTAMYAKTAGVWEFKVLAYCDDTTARIIGTPTVTPVFADSAYTGGSLVLGFSVTGDRLVLTNQAPGFGRLQVLFNSFAAAPVQP